MPPYDFQHAVTGEVREFLVPAGTDHLRRTDGAWKRNRVNRPGIVYAMRSEPGQKEEVLAGYAHEERRLGSRFRTRRPASEIKEIWNR